MTGFKYSAFISYRRNSGEEKFLKNFREILRTEAQKVTNVSDVFLDTDSIGWGSEFDSEIYNSLEASCFFIPIYHHTYLHEDNIWCARELYHALEVEKVIRRELNSESYYFILPILKRGNLSALPKCIQRKNARTIAALEHQIEGKRTSKALNDFKRFLYDTFLKSFELLENTKINLEKLCADIAIPIDDEIKTWIKEQKMKNRDDEANNIPRLNKSDE